jgi:hypothetical protein
VDLSIIDTSEDYSTKTQEMVSVAVLTLTPWKYKTRVGSADCVKNTKLLLHRINYDRKKVFKYKQLE